MTTQDTRPPWPYPRWIAHRGAGKLAPENTLAAFRSGASQGYRMFECDVKLSLDGVPFLLHDDTLVRTIPRVASITSSVRSFFRGRVKLGQPVPDSNLSFASKRSRPHHAHA